MFIRKKTHYAVVDALEAEKAVLQAALAEERAVSERLAAQVVHSIVAKCQAEDAVKTALAATDVVVRNADSALELALAKYGEAVS